MNIDVHPLSAGNRRNSQNLQTDLEQQKRLIPARYASVSFIDQMTGKALKALDVSGQRENTIVIFTSDLGYQLRENDLWSKVTMDEESARVPLIVSIPDRCQSLVELLDLYPTLSQLGGLSITDNIQGLDISAMPQDPMHEVRNSILCSGKGRFYREHKWALLD